MSAVVQGMTHNMETAPPAGTLDTSAECGAPFQQWVGAAHKTKDQKHFFTAALFELSSGLDPSSGQVQAQAAQPTIQPCEGIKHSPDPPFTLLLNTIKLLAASPDLAITYKTTCLFHPLLPSAPLTQGARAEHLCTIPRTFPCSTGFLSTQARPEQEPGAVPTIAPCT